MPDPAEGGGVKRIHKERDRLLRRLSRVTGLVREMVVARIFGVSAETDAFNVAFRLPNLLRRMFAEGAFQLLDSTARNRLQRSHRAECSKERPLRL